MSYEVKETKRREWGKERRAKEGKRYLQLDAERRKGRMPAKWKQMPVRKKADACEADACRGCGGCLREESRGTGEGQSGSYPPHASSLEGANSGEWGRGKVK